jgi:hypothetical protein
MERRRLPLAQVVLGLQRGDMFGVGELLVGEATRRYDASAASWSRRLCYLPCMRMVALGGFGAGQDVPVLVPWPGLCLGVGGLLRQLRGVGLDLLLDGYLVDPLDDFGAAAARESTQRRERMFCDRAFLGGAPDPLGRGMPGRFQLPGGAHGGGQRR